MTYPTMFGNQEILLPTITHPTDRPNFTRLDIHGITFWYSYETCIAYEDATDGRVICENAWNTTTGKHLNFLDYGSKTAKKARMSAHQFARMVQIAYQRTWYEEGQRDARNQRAVEDIFKS